MLTTSDSVVNRILISICPYDPWKGKGHTAFVPTPCERVEIERLMLAKAWSPIIFNKNYRAKKNFKESSLVVLDFDNGVFTLEKARELVDAWDLWCIIGTTKSHQIEKKTQAGVIEPACDRFRLILYTNEPCVDREQYEYNLKEWIGKLSGDPSCYDGARYFFPCKEIFYSRDGEPIEWQSIPAGFLRESDKQRLAYKAALRHKERGTIPAWIGRALKGGVVPGNRHRYCYAISYNLTAIGYGLDEIIGYLLKSPMSEIGVDDVRRAASNGAKKATEFIGDLGQ